MVRAAPRYAERLTEEIARLEDGSEPIAEICRRVAARAEALGLMRPSHVHLRDLVRAERERQRKVKAILALQFDALLQVMNGRQVDFGYLLARIDEIRAGDDGLSN